MRKPLLLASVFAFGACGDPASRGTTRPPETVSAPVFARPAATTAAAASEQAPPEAPAAPSEPRMSSAPVGSLEQPHVLKHLYEALAKLEEGRSHDDVRVLQYGDSHTASDLGTAVVRKAMQARFGDGGRGFVSLGKPWKTYVQDGIKNGQSPEFESSKIKFNKGVFTGDGMHGLAGFGLQTRTAGARAWTEASASRIEVAYLEQPQGGSFELFVDGSRAARVVTSGRKAQSAFKDLQVADGLHKIEVRAAGDGEVRIFGVTLDRAQAGVTFDALGINGAQISTPLRWNEAHMAEQLKHRNPDAVILAYGTNESLETYPPAEYERKLVDLLGRFARAVPTASCILLGPPDRAAEATPKSGEWATAPKLLEIVESQRRVALAAGCAFYNQLQAMGGAGTIAAWAKETPPRAGKDRVHLTKEGYAALANAFVADLLRAYAAYRAENGLPATAPKVSLR